MLYEAITIPLSMPPKIPGIPCKLFIPQVSLRPIFSSKKLVSFMYPKVETIPPIQPIVKLAAGLVPKPLTAPIITPPDNVALSISYILNFSRNKALMIKVLRQLPVSDSIVLLIINVLSKAFCGKYPALKDGQNIHKKRVPIIAIVELI